MWEGTSEATEHEPGHVVEVLTRTRAYTMSGRARLTRWLDLSATLPYLEREHTHETEHHPGLYIPYTWNFEGLGDAMLFANWSAFGTPDYGLGSFSLMAGMKLPTGETEAYELDGEQPEPPARLGTGSTPDHLIFGASFGLGN